jgi:integrase
MPPLSVPQIKAATYKPAGSNKLSDGESLFLVLKPNGRKVWRWRYWLHGKERTYTIGDFPEVSLKQAREDRDAARLKVRAGIDPVAERRAPKLAAAGALPFEELAAKYLADNPKQVGERTLGIQKARLDRWVNPKIGKRVAKDIEPPDVLALLRSIEKTGKIETATRVRELIGRIFRYGIGEGLGGVTRDPTRDLTGQTKAPQTTNRPALTAPREVGALMRAVDGYEGQPSTLYALRLIAHVFLRPGELRAGRWSEIDFEHALWRIPAERMKMKRDHLVPLSNQVLAMLGELQVITGDRHDGLMFPAVGPGGRPISENTLNSALRRLGYDTKTQHCAHGFRATASTLLNELGHDTAVIELQLSHLKKDEIEAAYNRAKRLPDRVRLMQAWSDYLHALKQGAEVVAIRRKA